jgi:hypothetical protein
MSDRVEPLPTVLPPEDAEPLIMHAPTEFRFRGWRVEYVSRKDGSQQAHVVGYRSNPE